MAKKYLDYEGLLYFWQKIKNTFVPSTRTVNGKALSSNITLSASDVSALPSSTTIPSAGTGSSYPTMDGTRSLGSNAGYARVDHVHPTDTSRAPLVSPAFTGTPTAPTAATGTSTTQLATTEFVANTVGAMTSGVSDVKVDGSSVVTDGIANIPYAGTNTAGVVMGRQGSGSPIDNFLEFSFNGTNKFKVPQIRTDTDVIDYTWLPEATTTRKGAMSVTDKTKLDSLTITNGVIDASNLPLIVNTRGTASSGGTTLSVVNTGDMYTWNNKIDSSAKGAANGVCPLNASSKIDSTYLPSYVDDVIEAYPRSGQTALSQNWLSTTSGGSALMPETGKIYVLMEDSGDYAANTQFRWGGSAYVKLADGGVSSITNAEIDTIVAA